MPRTRELLRRFRVAAAPGAAAPVGVPADRVAEAAAELEPVFARLAPAQAEAERIRAAARERADEIRRRTAEETAAVVADARDRAEAERASAGLAASRRLDQERDRALVSAGDEADRVRRHAADRLPAYVDRVADEVRRLLDQGPEAAAGP